jgi:hypothetical protein
MIHEPQGQIVTNLHSPDSIERRASVLFVEQEHQSQALLRIGARLVTQPRAGHVQQPEVPSLLDLRMIRFDLCALHLK